MVGTPRVLQVLQQEFRSARRTTGLVYDLSLIHIWDDAARETLICHNLRLVAHIVKKYYTVSGGQDDFISIGTIGLILSLIHI